MQPFQSSFHDVTTIALNDVSSTTNAYQIFHPQAHLDNVPNNNNMSNGATKTTTTETRQDSGSSGNSGTASPPLGKFLVTIL